MEITINGNITINNGIENAIPTETQKETQQQERQPIDRTNEVLIPNETSFIDLLQMLSSRAEARAAAMDEAEEKERLAREDRLRKLYGDDFDSMIEEDEKKSLEKAKRRPGAVQLRKYEPRIARIDFGDGVCEVFTNGYGIYDNGNRKTVLWVPDCGSVTYYFGQLKDSEIQYQVQKSEVGEDVFGPAPWYNALIVAGENQIERNLEHPKSIGTQSDEDDEDEEWEKEKRYRWVCGAHFDDPEETAVNAICEAEALSELNDYQREVFSMFRDGFKQSEIARMFGVSRQSVNETVKWARKKLKAYYEKIDDMP